MQKKFLEEYQKEYNKIMAATEKKPKNYGDNIFQNHRSSII